MGILFMLPIWSEAQEGWMQQMMLNISSHIAAVAVDDSENQGAWKNTVPVFSLNRRGKEIRILSRLGEKCGLSITASRSNPGRALRNILNKIPIKAIFCQYGTYAAQFMELWQETDIPLFVHFHGYDATFDLRRHENPNIYRHPANYLENIKELSKRAIFISNSEFTKKLLTDAGVAPDRIAIKYFGIPVSNRQHLHTRSSEIQIMHLGRLVDFKSPDRTIQAFELARKQGMKGRLVIAGDGPLRTTCELLKSKSPYSNSIHILGNVNSQVVQQLFDESDIFTAHNILGEITGQSECFGVSVLEAMASGLPVVGTKHGGVVESVIDGETGILNMPGDIEAQATSFIELAKDPGLRQKIGDSAKRRVLDKFSPQHETNQLKKIMNLLDETN